MSYDLIIHNGRVLDPSHNLDGIFDIAIVDGSIASIGSTLSLLEAKTAIDAKGKLVVPGLVDMHTHCYWGGVPGGLNADKIGPATGVTSWVDTGSAGAGNFEGFYYHVIRKSSVRIYPFLHISHVGTLLTDGLYVRTGELFDFRLANLHEIIRVGEAFRDVLCGIKVRASVNATGANSIAADALELPLMAHVGPPPPFIEDTLSFLREGDIVTHCFTPYHGGVVDHHLHIKEAVVEARGRGVLFDIGHGSGSFSFAVAQAALDQGFAPDMISTDLHSRNINGPVYDMPTTMSKFLALGMGLSDIIMRSTYNPAQGLGRANIGQIKEGMPADIAIMAIEEGEFDFKDAPGITFHGTQRLRAVTTILKGAIATPVEDDREEVSPRGQFPSTRRYRQ
jgi:dihydroorotase